MLNVNFPRKLFQIYEPYSEHLSRLFGALHMMIQPEWIADFLERTQRLRDPYENKHGRAVAVLAEQLAKEDGADEDEIRHIVLGARLHDVGKILIPESILNKPGRLTEQEKAMVRAHPEQGVAMLEPFALHPTIIDIVHHHHENLDGTGYPERIRDKDISRGVRIIRLCDSFESMITERSYKPSIDPVVALDMLRKEIGTKYDPVLFELLARIIQHNGHHTISGE